MNPEDVQARYIQTVRIGDGGFNVEQTSWPRLVRRDVSLWTRIKRVFRP